MYPNRSEHTWHIYNVPLNVLLTSESTNNQIMRKEKSNKQLTLSTMAVKGLEPNSKFDALSVGTTLVFM